MTLFDLISRDVRLRREGRRHLGLCPFHSERTPSFYLFPASDGQPEHYHCFGCGAHGDAIEWLMRTRRLSFADAKAALGEALPPRRSRPEITAAQRRETQEQAWLDTHPDISPEELAFTDFDAPRYKTTDDVLTEYLRG